MNPKNNLLEESLRLLDEQKQEWSALDKGYESLKEIKIKTILLKGFSFVIQYNPGRLTSTSAKTDAASIISRKCFLCNENRPIEQRAISVQNKSTGNKEFKILSNPFPIYPQHFTISSSDHIPQRIKENFNTLLYFSKVLSDGLTVIYNGPECGASAPDHLHLQAGTKNYLPIETEIHSIEDLYYKNLFHKDDLIINAIDDGFRRIIQIKSDNEVKAANAFNVFYNIYAEYPHELEPKMNILAPYNNGWNILIMLREKHRPVEYFTGELLLSPGSVDYGGLCITPLEKDFLRVDETLLRKVFSQLTLSQDTFNELSDKLSYSLNHS